MSTYCLSGLTSLPPRAVGLTCGRMCETVPAALLKHIAHVGGHVPKIQEAETTHGDKESVDKTNGLASLTLRKGLAILSLFDSDHPEWTFTEVWKKARLSRPTAFRLVRTLEEAKYLSFDPGKGTYHLGVSILKGTYLMLSPSEVARIARPFMKELASASTETVILTVEMDGEPMIASRVLTSRPFKPDNPVGMFMHGLGNVHSRIFLAFRPRVEQEKALALPIDRRTSHTSTDPAKIAAQLESIRREGLAYGLQEWTEGMCAVGAPIFVAGGGIGACLAVVAPIERFGPAEMVECGNAVREAAAELSEALGYEEG
jgi:DNA-binding IclR family transcriptional regulator